MKKKLGIIITVSVVGILVLSTIILSVVSKNYKPEFETTAIEIKVTNTDGDEYFGGKAYSNEQKENYEEFLSIFDSAFKQSILASMFSGKMNNQIEIDYTGTSEPTSSTYKVELRFVSTLLKLDGQAYKLTSSDTEKYFTSIIFFVDEVSGYNAFEIYAKVQIDEDSIGYYKITTLANQYQMYNFLTELDYQ